MSFKDLKVNRTLLDSSFEGYKLSLENLPQYSKKLITDIHEVKLGKEQYSFQHVKAFASCNYLFGDPSNDICSYWVSVDGIVFGIQLLEGRGLSEPQEVLRLPNWDSVRSAPGRGGVVLHFLSAEKATLSDGAGGLLIINTGDRTTISASQWKIEHSFTTEDVTQSQLLTASLTSNQIDCVLLRIADRQSHDNVDGDSEESPSKSTFYTELEWITFVQDADQWHTQRRRLLHGRCVPDYSVLLASASALALLGNSCFSFVSDTAKPVEQREDTQKNEAGKENTTYVWTQSEDDIIVELPVKSATAALDKSLIKYKLTSSQLELVYDDTTLLNGTLGGPVVCDECTWLLQDSSIELQLSKLHAGNMWQELIVGDKRGRLVIDADTAVRLSECLAHLTADGEESRGSARTTLDSHQLEECDAPPEQNSTLYVLDGERHAVAQQVSVSAHQFLFRCTSSPDYSPPSLCLRHDVDGLLWQPPLVDSPCPAEVDNPWQHQATFNALGYVQASKTQRRMTCCAPNGSWALVVEVRQRAYLYRQPQALLESVELRNRRTGQKVSQVSKQQLITLDTMEPIIGAATSNNHVMLATPSQIVAIRV